jgi:hypothetical protein
MPVVEVPTALKKTVPDSGIPGVYPSFDVVSRISVAVGKDKADAGWIIGGHPNGASPE